LTRHLLGQGISVVEAVRPNRQTRRRRGRTDAIDAETAAHSVLAGTALGMPKTADGAVEMTRALRLVRRSATKARTQAANQLRAVLVTAPQTVRDRLRTLSMPQLVDAATRCRPGQLAGTETASKLALKSPDTSSSRQKSPRPTPKSRNLQRRRPSAVPRSSLAPVSGPMVLNRRSRCVGVSVGFAPAPSPRSSSPLLPLLRLLRIPRR
jgi:transposase